MSRVDLRGVERVGSITVRLGASGLAADWAYEDGELACHDPSGRAKSRDEGVHGPQSARGPTKRIEGAAVGSPRGKEALAGALVERRGL